MSKKLVLVDSEGDLIPNVEPYVLKDDEDLNKAIEKFFSNHSDLIDSVDGTGGGYFQFTYQKNDEYYQAEYVQTDVYSGGVKVIEDRT